MPNKQTTDGNYRYAFQGQEKDPETGMEAFQLRLWDGRIGRWLSPDPYGQYASPYMGMGNNPLSLVDPDGGTAKPPTDFINKSTGETLHIEDGFDQVVLVDNNSDWSILNNLISQESWNIIDSNNYFNIISKGLIDMNSDFGMIAKTVYAEMRSGNMNAKTIVAESLRNRNDCNCYEGKGGYSKFIPRFYDAAKPSDKNFSKWNDPYISANKSKLDMGAWLGSLSASWNAYSLNSNVGQGVLFYNSANANYYDKNSAYNKINLNVSHTGIKGLWNLK